jgi:O-antigen/teichoic acid export membrane protein
MSSIKRLAGQTIYYGLSSILGRFISFILTPVYTYSTIVTQAKLGQLTELMSYTSIILIFFTLRMEIAYFRYGKAEGKEKETYDASITAVWLLSIIFGSLIVLFAPMIASWIDYSDRVIFIHLLGLIMAIDGCCEIPFSKLRFENKARKFAMIKIASISTNVILNLFFVMACPILAQHFPGMMSWWDPEQIITLIFLSNVLSSLASLLFLIPVIRRAHFQFNKPLISKMFRYALPLAIVGILGMFNDMFGRIVLKWWLPGTMEENQVQLGIYGANYRLTVLIVLFTQAYRYAAEPFFFKESEKEDNYKVYADSAKYFAIFSLLGYLFVILFIDILKHFIAPRYWEGLPVLPILLMANVFLGLYYNISVWYRLKDRTMTGALIAAIGAVIIVLLNWWWIPAYGYIGSAWATLISYISITIICYWIGRKAFPVPYQFRLIFMLIVVAVALQWISTRVNLYFTGHTGLHIVFGVVLMAAYMLLIWTFEHKAIRRLIRR